MSGISVVKSTAPSSDEVAEDESDISACDVGYAWDIPPSAPPAPPPVESSASQLHVVKIPELCSTPAPDDAAVGSAASAALSVSVRKVGR